MKKYVKIAIYVELFCQPKNILYMKLDKMSYSIYADIESLVKKIGNCKNNPEKSSKTKIGKHIPCGYSMPTNWAFNHMKNKHSLYPGQDCVKSFVVL